MSTHVNHFCTPVIFLLHVIFYPRSKILRVERRSNVKSRPHKIQDFWSRFDVGTYPGDEVTTISTYVVRHA